MGQKNSFSEMLEQVHDNLLNLIRLLEQAGVQKKPQVAHGWADGQEVMEALHISQRTLQTLRDNGTLGYSVIGGKFYYRLSEINDLLQNNYVMYKLSALGKNEPSLGQKQRSACPPAAGGRQKGATDE